MSSYETNMLKQPSEWKKLLGNFIPEELNIISYKRIFFVGIGSSYCVARIAEFLWREYVTNTLTKCTTRIIPQPSSCQSFDFVKSSQPLSNDDIAVVFSHRGSNSFSVQALEVAKRLGARTVLVTGIGSPHNSEADIRLDTCSLESSEAFTISVTSALVRIIQWIGLYNRSFLEKFNSTVEVMEEWFPFKVMDMPKFTAKIIIVGDLIREIAAHETAFKIAETSYLPVRSFGLEEFLHGHHLTLDKLSSPVIFSSLLEPRRHALLKYGKAVGCEIICVDEEKFSGPKEFRWLFHLLWGQQLALNLSKQLNTNPDTAREDQHLYRKAKDILKL